MARRKARGDGVQLVVAIAIVTLAVAVGGYFLFREGGGDAAPAATPAPPVPQGRLQVLRLGLNEARLLGLDDIRREGGVVEASVYVLGRSAKGLEGGAAMTAQRNRFDCAAGRLFDGDVAVYDADGKLIDSKTLYSGRLGRLPTSDEVEAKTLCAGEASARGKVFTGFRAAQRELQSPPDDYETTLAARDDKADAYAWLCAAGARKRWRATTPADCDKAVSLNPDSAEARVDRAFLRLKTGKNAASRSDFNAVLARDPENAAALFGRGLLAAMDRDMAASRRDRGKALDADPGVIEWIEARYAFLISDDVRGR